MFYAATEPTTKDHFEAHEQEWEEMQKLQEEHAAVQREQERILLDRGNSRRRVNEALGRLPEA